MNASPAIDWQSVYPGTPTGATFGPLGEEDPYRYTLHRCWAPDRPPEVWIMCNPSKAGVLLDDATIRRVKRFSHDWGAGGALVVNLYGLRATNPRELGRAADPVGPLNLAALEAAFELAARAGGFRSRVICAWGAVGETGPEWRDRVRDVVTFANRHRVSLTRLSTTASGAPEHPLRLPAALRPQDWVVPRAIVGHVGERLTW